MHFINENWILQKSLIDFRKICNPYTVENICSTIMHIFKLYDIKDKVCSITFDNASNNTTTILIFM